MRKPVLANKIVQQAPSMIKTPNDHDNEKSNFKIILLEIYPKTLKICRIQ